MHLVLYEDKFKLEWDAFVRKSINGTFLLLRDYMDYHNDRFIDSSFLFYNNKNQLVALLPANRKEDALFSHQGLTYGGIIFNDLTQPKMLQIFQCLLEYSLENNIRHIIYKTIPHIYHKAPSDHDQYALFLLNAAVIRKDCLSVIDNNHRFIFQDRRIRAIKKAKKLNLSASQTQDFSAYWDILTDNLKTKHHASPVHRLEEMQLLAERFPQNIKLFGCFHDSDLLAGIIIYESELVAHFQYIAATPLAKSIGALDWLFATLINDIYATKKYIDFGISNENEGRRLNIGLIDFKEGFGGNTISHDFYHITVSHDHLNLLKQALL